MFLIIISDLDFGAQRKTSFIGRKKIVKDLQHGSFASTVVSDKSYTFSTFDLEGDIMKQFLSRETFGKIFYSENIISADNAWL